MYTYIISRQKNLLQNDDCELIFKTLEWLEIYLKKNGRTAKNQERDVDIVMK